MSPELKQEEKIADKLEDKLVKFNENVDKLKENFYSIVVLIFTFLRKFLFSIKVAIFLIIGFVHVFYPGSWIEYGIVPGLFEIIFYYIMISFFFSFLQFTMIYFYRKNNNLPIDTVDNLTIGIGRISFIVTHTVFFFVFLYLMGFNFREFLTFFSLVGFSISLIFKDYISNFINGTIVMFSKDFRLKEYIKVGEYRGRIVDVSFLNIKLKTDEGDVVFIPNNVILSKEVTNYSKSSSKKVKMDFRVGLNFSSKIKLLEEFMSKRLCEEFNELINNENISLKIHTIDKDSIMLLLEIEVLKYNFKIDEKMKKLASSLVIDFFEKTKSQKEKPLSVEFYK